MSFQVFVVSGNALLGHRPNLEAYTLTVDTGSRQPHMPSP